MTCDLQKMFEDLCKKNKEDPTGTANMVIDRLSTVARPGSALMLMNPKEKKMIIAMQCDNGDIVFDSDYHDFNGEYYKQLENFFQIVTKEEGEGNGELGDARGVDGDPDGPQRVHERTGAVGGDAQDA